MQPSARPYLSADQTKAQQVIQSAAVNAPRDYLHAAHEVFQQAQPFVGLCLPVISPSPAIRP
ncbi:hypothetical protein D3C71_2223840 [compost metagenome]